MNRKLYVWDDVFSDYTSGCAMAFATSKEDAAKQIAEAKNLPRDFVTYAGKLSTEEIAARRAEWVRNDFNELMKSDCTEHELDKPFTFWMYGGG